MLSVILDFVVDDIDVKVLNREEKITSLDWNIEVKKIGVVKDDCMIKFNWMVTYVPNIAYVAIDGWVVIKQSPELLEKTMTDWAKTKTADPEFIKGVSNDINLLCTEYSKVFLKGMKLQPPANVSIRRVVVAKGES